MQILDGQIIYSATDLNNFLACGYLTQLDMDVARGLRTRPEVDDGQGPLLAKLGEEHEQNYLQRLMDDGHPVTTIERGYGIAGIIRAATDTEAAMKRGDDLIYQATFFHEGWVGHTDFLRRVSRALPGGHWNWHYEVEDTKLARHTEPYFLLQLAYYSEHVARVQGGFADNMHVVLGNGKPVTFRVTDAIAYYRNVRQRFTQHSAANTQPAYPNPIPHCDLCVWTEACQQRWNADDHLSLVANVTRLQVDRLNDAEIHTLHELAIVSPEHKPAKMSPSTFETLQRQARLQSEQRLSMARGDEFPFHYEILKSGLDEKRGFHRLPEPSPNDIFFDMEGDPYYDIGTGLEYLFGTFTVAGGFRGFWGCDRETPMGRDRLAEKQAFEEFIDYVISARDRDPLMHIYHYAPYEKTALQKLAQRHATREDQVDRILREEILVDLYAIVRQAIAVGQPSYSIKKLEDFYGKRSADSGIAAGDDSILRFEEWLATRHDPRRRDDTILANLERYNEYDCISTHGLLQWLLNLRDEARSKFSVAIAPYTGAVTEAIKADIKNLELKAALDAKIPEDFDPMDPDRGHEAWPYFLARHMLEYHWREHKPVHWRFHDRCATYVADPSAMLDDMESIVGIEPHGEPQPDKKSIIQEFHFPTQLHKIADGDCFDLNTKESAGSIVAVEDDVDHGRLFLRRGPKFAGIPFPAAVTLRKIIQPSTILDAIVRFDAELLTSGDQNRYRAAYDVLMSHTPRLAGKQIGDIIQPAVVDEISVRALCDALDDSYLFIQGPPGSGKTYLGARLIAGLIADGKRVGVAANSHKAIHNLLDEVERVADERGIDFIGIKKSSAGDPDTRYESAHFTSNEKSLADPSARLVAGTAWAYGPDTMDQQLDFLFIDEAGQVSLPHAIAMMTSAKNAVLLGDPLQLAQVALTQHPGDLGVSVLEHILDHDLRPVAPTRGVLLTDSYRMHPDVCDFISDLLYDGRLHAAADRDRQLVASPGLSGTGLRYIPVKHSGNSQSSDDEAATIVAEIEHLLNGSIRDIRNDTRNLEQRDIIVVTPYNAQVRCLRRALDARGFSNVEAGTVDKFQGREAYVVFFSTAASSADDAPRGASFIFDRQRFNVAISRARALAVMVGSPELLMHRVGSVEDVRIANGVCNFIERTA